MGWPLRMGGEGRVGAPGAVPHAASGHGKPGPAQAGSREGQREGGREGGWMPRGDPVRMGQGGRKPVREEGGWWGANGWTAAASDQALIERMNLALGGAARAKKGTVTV